MCAQHRSLATRPSLMQPTTHAHNQVCRALLNTNAAADKAPEKKIATRLDPHNTLRRVRKVEYCLTTSHQGPPVYSPIPTASAQNTFAQKNRSSA